ncbi:MAG TPA: hypothetical protein PLW48_04205 [Alphaproteobacteria bacterium]|nr:hypothetical protein [Alphaproteobacteria bacterium]
MRTAAHYIAVNMPQLWTGLKPSTAAGIESGANNVAGAGKPQCFTQTATQNG